jgi:hypoxanthine phosphoribosyltransferase
MTIDEEHTPDREVLGWDEFGEASRELAAQVHGSGFVPDMVVAIARGGLLLAGSVAYALDVKSCGAINVELLSPMLDTPSVSGQKVLLVDDVSDSGRTLAMVLELLLKAGADVRSLCLYSKPQTVLEPDFVWRRTSKWIAFPWSSLPPVTV